jgi:phospholipid-binding lipoprotein MlaA
MLAVAMGALAACVDEERFDDMAADTDAAEQDTAAEPPAEAAETEPEATDEAAADENDPLEDVNRVIFEVNRTIDETLLKPAAIIYRGVVPDWGRERIDNMLFNLSEPVNFANALLQGDFDQAGTTFGRFVLNSTVGFFGMFDVASEGAGLEKRSEDFGQTLAVWGLGEGPYLMLPVFGPSNPRDATGLIVDFFIDPFGYVFDNDVQNLRTGVRAVHTRSKYIEELETVEETSVDFYAALRNLYRQQREADIRNGELPPETMDIPVYDEEDEE